MAEMVKLKVLKAFNMSLMKDMLFKNFSIKLIKQEDFDTLLASNKIADGIYVINADIILNRKYLQVIDGYINELSYNINASKSTKSKLSEALVNKKGGSITQYEAQEIFDGLLGAEDSKHWEVVNPSDDLHNPKVIEVEKSIAEYLCEHRFQKIKNDRDGAVMYQPLRSNNEKGLKVITYGYCEPYSSNNLTKDEYI